MKKNQTVLYSSPRREVVYEIEPSRMKRGKMLVTRNGSFKDQVYMSKNEAQVFIDTMKDCGYIEAEL